MDIGRNKLAVICGHKDWKAWKASTKSRDEIYNTALTRLKTLSNDVPKRWADLGRKQTALQLLLLPNRLRDRGDIAAHASAPKNLGESIFALPEEQHREDLTNIFWAIFNEEPAH